MSKINRIRIMNLNYNGNTIRIDDETFDLNGQSTLLSLRNGGGKTVLVQMVISLFVNKTYRDFDDRPFKSYFTTNRPTFLMTEWALDYGQGYFLAGMMVRKSQNTEETNNEELEIYTFTGFYRSTCPYDIAHLPVIEKSSQGRLLKGFGACLREFEELKKDKNGDFTYYDMSSAYQRRQYFSKLKEYQINHKEWESIIKKVNLKESGLSELFTNAKDERGLVERWLLDAVENKLNQGNSRIKGFQSLAQKLIRQYRENQSNIRRKEIIEQYFVDAQELVAQIDRYSDTEEKLVRQKSQIALFIKKLALWMEQLVLDREKKGQEILFIEQQLKDIEHEKRSYEIWQLEEKRKDMLHSRIESELRITKSEYAKEEAEKKLCLYQCASLYAEQMDFLRRVSSLQAKRSVLLDEQKGSAKERDRIGGSLYHYYQRLIMQKEEELTKKESEIQSTEAAREACKVDYEKELRTLRELSGRMGGLSVRLRSYDKVEQRFYDRYLKKSADMELARNLLGEYEEGTLALYNRKFEEELTQLNVELGRYSEELHRLKAKEEALIEESESLSLHSSQCEHELMQLKKEYQSMQEEKERRRGIMRYMELADAEIDNKGLLLAKLGGRLEELEEERAACAEKQKAFRREYENLSQGRIVELPEAIVEYFKDQGIDVIYGMEWLKKNQRGAEENQRLTERNPFLPYSIILGRDVIRRLGKAEKEIYTSFPIPIVVREELDKALEVSENGVLSFGSVHFFVMFNQHLLHPEDLTKLLEEKQQQIKLWQERAERKRREIQEYQSYWNVVERQSYSEDLLKENQRQVKLCEEKHTKLSDAYVLCGQKRKKNQLEQEQVRKRLEEGKEAQQTAQRRLEEFGELTSAYESYLVDRQERERLEKKEKNTKEKIGQLKEEEQRLTDQLLYNKDIKKGINSELSSYKRKSALYQSYQEESEWEEQVDYVALEARYHAITEGISTSIEELSRDLQEENQRLERKIAELKRRNRYHFQKEEYQSLSYSEDMTEYLEQQIKAAAREENAAKEENKGLEKQIAKLDVTLEYARKHMEEKTGYKELVPREKINSTDFDDSLRLAGYECDKRRAELRVLMEKIDACKSTQDAMAEYMDFSVTCQVEEREIPSASREELNQYQGKLRRDLRILTTQREEQRRLTQEMIRKVSAKEIYQEDFFRKGFENLLSLVNQVEDLRLQLETLLASYNSIQQKLQVDLENIERERKSTEEIFFDYVKDIDDHMRQIDKNSSITVRGKTIRMLRIYVPAWEENRELYQKRIQDFTDEYIKWGLDAVEKNQNVDELLGKLITTKKLYDDVVGIRNIEIRLYKIEAEREVPISWTEVSANSGGEGFLSAFVILSSLLSYMRRDESDLFASGEEGKVLIMDNPFAQTNAVHLLKPLMDMAKKTNTQLICLSGLGGDSIYNRFDNIYVLNVVSARIKQGMRYLKSEHIKGEEDKTILPSQFQTEQIELF